MPIAVQTAPSTRRRLLRPSAVSLTAPARLRGPLPPARGSRPAGRAPTAPPPTYGRMFGALPAFAENSAGLREALLAIGAPGGPMDANDDLYGPGGGPVALAADPTRAAAAANDPGGAAGLAFFGQFVNHDLTFGTVAPPTACAPQFDLSSVYGRGPIAQRELYDPARPITLRVESGGRHEDVPRRADHSPVIADPRNDSNLLVSALHAAVCRFHNNAVDLVNGPGRDPIDVFDAARRLTTWHYQWLVVNRILPSFVGQALVDDVLQRGTRFFRPYTGPYLPVEFSGAAYRFGLSTVRPSYRANLDGDNGQPFVGLIFDPRVTVPAAMRPVTDPGDLRGGFRSARRFVDWQAFFDFGGAHSIALRSNKPIGTVVSTPLFAVPGRPAAASADSPAALPQLALLRHLAWALPSGQRVAEAMGVPRLAAADLADFGAYGHDLDTSTPLWLYVLREAALVSGGRHLGPVGGRIVAEVMIGVLRASPDSYLFTRPTFQPMLGARPGSDYEIADFLRFARVDPDSRGQ